MVIGLTGDVSVRRTTIATTSRDESGVIRGLELPGDIDQLRARAAVLDVTALVPVVGDAIKIKLEHSEGVAIDMLVPYRIDSEGATIDVQAANAVRADPLFWNPEAPKRVSGRVRLRADLETLEHDVDVCAEQRYVPQAHLIA